MFWMFLLLGPLVALAEPTLTGEKVNSEMVVVGHSDFEVYVAPTIIRNEAPEIEAVIGKHTVLRYASTHSKLAQIESGYRSYEPLNLNHDDFKVYDENTIKYAWEDCDYKNNAKACAYQNNHYLLETYITVDTNQLVIEMMLFDTDMQIVAQSSQTSNLKIRWIKQQEITTNVNESGIMPNQQSTATSCNSQTKSCGSGGSVTQNSGNYRREVQVNKPKEEMPLKWEIPHKLLDSHMRQASLKLWLGMKIKL